MRLVTINRKLAADTDRLRFGDPVTHVYNPLQYARRSNEQYLERFGSLGARVVLLGMNPGPWGMAQTGVPFGDVEMVRDWMGIEALVDRPANEHPKRPVDGFACPRSEVSGSRLWGWARAAFGEAERFFERFFVINYCPLSFMEASGRNRTPDKLSADERAPLYETCDDALRAMVAAIDPEWVLGVGKFAEARARTAIGADAYRYASILHPSPASPIANRGWAPQAESQLRALGLL